MALNELSQFRIANKNILIIKGQGGRKKLRYHLLKRGANLKYINSYLRRETNISISQILKAKDLTTPDVIIITSGSILLALAKKLNQKIWIVYFAHP